MRLIEFNLSHGMRIAINEEEIEFVQELSNNATRISTRRNKHNFTVSEEYAKVVKMCGSVTREIGSNTLAIR